MGRRSHVATEAVALSTPRRVRVLVAVVATAAIGATLALVTVGSPVPAIGPVLLLAIAAALCVNRFALFPNEHAATAEAAVLLAAVVGFRATAPYVGPLLVALLVGPLDAVHWEQRAFLRMIYNSGNRALATLAAAAGFAAALEVAGSTTWGWVVAVVVASAAFTAVDVALSVALLRVQGDRLASARAHIVDIDALTFPVACVGATAGILATDVGWWAAAVVLVPVAFLPELVISRARVRRTAVVDLAVLLSLVSVLAVVALVSPTAGTVTLAALVGVAALVGTELVLERGALVPPMIATVVAAAVLAGGAHARVAALLVAIVATASAWWCSPARMGARFVGALAVAGVAALLAAEAASAVEGPADVAGIAALLGAVVFACGAMIAAPGRRRRAVALVWSVPLLAVAAAWAAAWAESWEAMGVAGAAVWVAVMAVAAFGADGWGAPPWHLRHAVAPRHRARVALVAISGLVAVAAAVTGIVGAHGAALGWGWVSSGAGELVVVMTACGVRQWRFAPRARARGLVVTLTASLVLLAAVPGLVGDGSWFGPVLVTVVLMLVLAEARALLRVGDQRVEVP
jgi:hypothetical protein